MPAKPSVTGIAREIVATLLAAADVVAAKQGQSYFKEPVNLIGVGVPRLRRLAREITGRLKGQWDLADTVALCNKLLADPRIEVKATAILVLERFKRDFDPSLIVVAERWIKRGWCDSWGIIDALCGCIVGPLLQTQPSAVRLLKNWPASPNPWLRRAAAVALVKPARRGQLLDEAYRVVDQLTRAEEDLVRKATGWLLREAGRTDAQRVERYLREHGRQLSRITVRYALERFGQPLRKELLRQTRDSRP